MTRPKTIQVIAYDEAVLCLSCARVSNVAAHHQICPACAMEGMMPIADLLEPYLNLDLRVHEKRVAVHDVSNFNKEFHHGV